MSVARACRAEGRNCGSGWRARNACSQAYSETHTQDTYDNMQPRVSDILVLDQGMDIRVQTRAAHSRPPIQLLSQGYVLLFCEGP